MYSYLCHRIQPAGEPSHLPQPFSYGFIKKCNARDIIDKQLRRQKCSPTFIGVSMPSQQASTSTLTTQRELQMNPTPLLLLPQSSSVACSDNLFSILNLQFFTSNVLNSWCGFHQGKRLVTCQFWHFHTEVTADMWIFEWWLHRIMAWPSCIMRFSGERVQTRGWRALCCNSWMWQPSSKNNSLRYYMHLWGLK